MFRVLVDNPIYGGGVRYVEAACNSTDTKLEENYITGSLCIEIDTGNVFAFDEEAETGSKWVQWFSFQE